jgi:NADH dehydrogenase
VGEDEIRAYLVELKDALLPEMPAKMGRYARRQLTERGYQVLLGTAIKEVREDEVVVGEDGRTIPTRTVIWTGGVRPAPLVAESGVTCDHAGRALVEATMETSAPGVFAIGDCASIPRPEGSQPHAYAPTAQNAVREGKQLADNILARIDGRELRPFRYETIGQLASIGAHQGVGVVFGIKVRGLIAWVMWRGYYWSRVPGFNRKVRVAIDWALTALFGADSVQLKVDDAHSALGSTGRRRPPLREDAPTG